MRCRPPLVRFHISAHMIFAISFTFLFQYLAWRSGGTLSVSSAGTRCEEATYHKALTAVSWPHRDNYASCFDTPIWPLVPRRTRIASRV